MSYGPHADRYLSSYCSPRVTESTLEAAVAAVRAHAGNCNGVTYQAGQDVYTGRQGTTLKTSSNGEISWLTADGCAGAIYSNGNPSSTYCAGNGGQYPWWAYCCKWENGE